MNYVTAQFYTSVILQHWIEERFEAFYHYILSSLGISSGTYTIFGPWFGLKLWSSVQIKLSTCEGYSLIVGDDVYFLWISFLFVHWICPHFMLLQMQTSVSLTERWPDDEVNRWSQRVSWKCNFILKDSKGIIHYHTTQLVSTAMEIHIQSFHIYTSSNNQTEIINTFFVNFTTAICNQYFMRIKEHY